MDTLSNLVLMVLSELHGVPERRYAGARRLVVAAAFTALAVVVAAGAFGCAVAAFWIYLASIFGPLGAAVGSTVMLFFVSIVLILLAGFFLQDGQRPNSAKDAVGDDLRREIHRGLESNKGAVLLAAFIAGIAAGSSTRPK
jgi:hypothetical protein